ncbi:hypothetical protein RhiirA4_469083 [Rhizophagus irregularis]|uniref:Uncharacterized protein n=1 Tax=Rhizophagus irregularis TaxID=588596 RepID=A0A2I1GYW8_9GLOM|nr:hypothetical protein RhiirA4_469083 [Rhizophagus irregularis]
MLPTFTKFEFLNFVRLWSDDETDKLLSYLKDNYEKLLQGGKKAAMYNLISTEIIKTKSSDSIKGRIKRLLENIFGCRENINTSFLSNDSTRYISNDEEKEVKTTKRKRIQQ